MLIRHFHTLEQIKEACTIAKRARLYAIWGTMRHWYADPERFVKAAFIAYENNSPVGSFIIIYAKESESYYNCGTYVLKQYRRKGYGKEMIALAKSLGYYIVPWKECMSAKLFYESVL